MRGSPPSFPPPEDAAARYDAVLRRGRSLRRRHQVAVGAGTGGLVALVLVAVVGLTAARGGDDNKPVTDPRPTTTTSTTTTTTTKPVFAMTADATSDRVAVTITDPGFPVAPGARQCVYLRVAPAGPSGTASAEDIECAGAGQPDVTTDLTPIEAEIGCAGVAVNGPAPTTTGTQPVTHTFTFTMPPGLLEAGKYVAEVSGTSGIGDGCAPNGPDEAEKLAGPQDVPFTVTG